MRTALFALPMLVLTLTGCTDDTPVGSGSTTTPAPPPTPTTTPPAGPDDPLASSSPLETAPPAGLPTCDAADLTVTDADRVYTQVAEQSLFTVRTTGPDCQLQGYPVVELLDAAGAALPGTLTRGGLGLPEPAAEPITLSRATSLSFFTATSRDATPCLEAAQLRVTLPGTAVPLTAATTTRTCGAAVGVGPVQRLGDDE